MGVIHDYDYCNTLSLPDHRQDSGGGEHRLDTGVEPLLCQPGRHVPTEQAAIAIARDLHAQGLSSRKVADQLAAQGFLSRTGTVFCAKSILSMVA